MSSDALCSDNSSDECNMIQGNCLFENPSSGVKEKHPDQKPSLHINLSKISQKRNPLQTSPPISEGGCPIFKLKPSQNFLVPHPGETLLLTKSVSTGQKEKVIPEPLLSTKSAEKLKASYEANRIQANSVSVGFGKTKSAQSISFETKKKEVPPLPTSESLNPGTNSQECELSERAQKQTISNGLKNKNFAEKAIPILKTASENCLGNPQTSEEACKRSFRYSINLMEVPASKGDPSTSSESYQAFHSKAIQAIRIKARLQKEPSDSKLSKNQQTQQNSPPEADGGLFSLYSKSADEETSEKSLDSVDSPQKSSCNSPKMSLKISPQPQKPRDCEKIKFTEECHQELESQEPAMEVIKSEQVKASRSPQQSKSFTKGVSRAKRSSALKIRVLKPASETPPETALGPGPHSSAKRANLSNLNKNKDQLNLQNGKDYLFPSRKSSAPQEVLETEDREDSDCFFIEFISE